MQEICVNLGTIAIELRRRVAPEHWSVAVLSSESLHLRNQLQST